MFALSPEEMTAVRLSLRVAAWAMAGSLPLCIIMAMVLARGRFWGKPILDGIVHLPLILPPVVTGYFLLLLFGRRGPLGEFLEETFGVVFAFRWTGAARSEEHTSELQSLMRISYAVFCLKKKKHITIIHKRN